MLREVAIKVTASKVSCRLPPTTWVRITAANVPRNVGAREVPDLNAAALPESGVDTVQVRTKAAS